MILAVPLAGCLEVVNGPFQGPESDEVGPMDADGDAAAWVNRTIHNPPQESICSCPPGPWPHRHDYWRGRQEVSIVDRNVTIEWDAELREDPERMTQPAWTVDAGPETRNGWYVPNLVFLGTGRIEITLRWEGGIGPKRLCVTNAARHEDLCGDDEARREHWFETSGETWTIPDNSTDGDFLTEQTVDPPHSRKSDWRFQVWLCAGGRPAEPADRCAADLTTPSFHLNVTVVHGPKELPLDPPHFPFYDDEDRILIMNWSQAPIAVQADWLGQAYDHAHRDGRPYAYFNGYRITNDSAVDSEVPVVAWDTGHLEVTVTARSANDVPLQFRYSTAADPWGAVWKDAGDPCTDRCNVTVPVDPFEVDGPYNERTQWEFALFPADPPAQPMVQYELGLEIWGIKRGAG